MYSTASFRLRRTRSERYATRSGILSIARGCKTQSEHLEIAWALLHHVVTATRNDREKACYHLHSL